MTQVLLSRKTTQQVVWIPSHFAVKGRYLRVVDENGWKVEQVYGNIAFQLTGAARGFRHLFGSIQ